MEENNYCELCGRSNAEKRINPYKQVIGGEDVFEFLCDFCYTDLVESI